MRGSRQSQEDLETLRGALRPRGPVRFGITESRRPGAVALQITGELDALTAPKLAAELNTVMRRSEEAVVLDLRQAQFIDSAGLQMLLGIQRRLSQASRKLTVVCDTGPVRRVIELARLDEVLNVTAGEDVPPT